MSKFLGGVLQGNETVFLTQDEINNPYADIPTMIEDKKRKQVQMKQTLFHRITQSPEVLAESLVFWEGGWTSRFIKFTTTNREEAVTATVAKLKEVAE